MKFEHNFPAKKTPVALTIAGSDSGGGAGIQADLKTFAALGVHGTSAITCLTAQHPNRVLGVQPCSPALLRQQLEAIFLELKPAAAKTGMLFSAALIRETAAFFKHQKRIPLIVDPVMVSTSGAKLLQNSAIRTLCDHLLPLSTVVTPNVPEAEVLLGKKLKSIDDLINAAHEIRKKFGCTALVKGGHLPARKEAVDVFYDGKNEIMLRAPFIRKISTHGTGCTYAAALTAWVARGLSLADAAKEAKKFISQAIAQSVQARGHFVLNWFWEREA